MNKRLKKFLVLLAVLLVSMAAAHYSFSSNIGKLYRHALAHGPYDAIIVPGIPYNGTEWDRIMKGRVLWSKHLYDVGIAKNVIYSGSAVHSPYVEAQIMALYAEQLGIPKEHIFIEDQALHSVENLYYSWGIAKAMGFEKLAVATDPYQSVMLGTFIWKWDLKMDKIPLVKEILDSMALPETIKINAGPYLVKEFVELKKRESWWTSFKGTMGLGVNFNTVPTSKYTKLDSSGKQISYQNRK